MGIVSALGLGGRKIRYAIVGLGDIAQEALMPGVSHTGNSTVTALVSGDPAKLTKLGKRYGVKNLYSYEQFPALLASGEIDAIYLATPNWRHAEFAVPALEAGIHVLSEKPLDVSSEKARAIMAAAAKGKAQLMTAYRLHFEPGTLAAIDMVRDGKLGDLVTFSATFSQSLDPDNHRAKHGIVAGPLFDMGPYPINAIRYLFGQEPVAVESAVATRQASAGFGDLDDTFAVVLRMPGDRLASFTVSYYAGNVDHLTIAGTKGSIHIDPAFGYGDTQHQTITIGTDKREEKFKPTDQFGGEMKYFSDCIMNGEDPEPDAEEGIADLRVVEGIVEALKTGRRVDLPPFERRRRINTATQKQTLSPITPPETVKAKSPSGN